MLFETKQVTDLSVWLFYFFVSFSHFTHLIKIKHSFTYLFNRVNAIPINYILCSLN